MRQKSRASLKIPFIGRLLFNYGFLTYLCVIAAVALSFFLFKTRMGLNLRAVGESPATADAAGINVIKYKYVQPVSVQALQVLEVCILSWNTRVGNLVK